MAKTLTGPSTDITIVETPDALADLAARLFVQAAAESIAEHGRFMVALAGGSTPRGLHARLAADPLRARVAWRETWVFFGDERCVPPTDRDSNYLMANETLLAHVPVPPGQVFRIRGEAPDAALAAAEYEGRLCAAFERAPVCFDLILLGMGLDGHVASLFPGSPALDEKDRLAIAVDVRAAVVPRRITLTLPVLNAARRVLFLVAGAEKTRSTADALGNPASALPAARVRPPEGAVTWLLDRAAAANLA